MSRVLTAGVLIAALLSSASAQPPIYLGPNGPVDLRDHDLYYAEGSCKQPGCQIVLDRLLKVREDTRTFCAHEHVFNSDVARDASKVLCRQVQMMLDVYADELTDSAFKG